jgi:2-oxoglutarate/2-oxoacid ferredoxin oxidoreductase subunit alpha
LLRKFETAKNFVPKPLRKNAPRPTRYGVLYFGSTAPAMDEATAALEAQGIDLNLMRVRAFPFSDEVINFILDHDQVFLIEQNRDAQLKTLLISEGAIDPARLISVLHYDGTPVTARSIVNEIAGRWTILKGKTSREVAE